MKKIFAWVILTLLVLVPLVVLAEGTLTTTPAFVPGQNTKVVRVSWTADNFSSVPFAEIDKFDGFLFAVKTNPTGTVLDNYDIELRGSETNYEYLGGNLVDRDTTNTELYIFSTPVPVYETVKFSLTGIGDLEAGVVDFYITVPK